MSVITTAAHMPASFSNWLPAKRLPVFSFLLSGIAVLITLVLGFEGYMQAYYPEGCLLAHLQQYGILSDYDVVFAPNKGLWHITGWAGTFLMVIMHVYSLRKKVPFMSEWGMLRHWLDFHIFCGILGPVLVTYHSTFRVGGIVSVSYWATVLVAMSGLFGRYILGFIPRGIAGHELEIEDLDRASDYMTYRIQTFYRKAQNLSSLVEKYVRFERRTDPNVLKAFMHMMNERYESFIRLRRLNRLLRRRVKLPKQERLQLIRILKEKLRINRRINFLSSAHKMFQCWHRVHVICTAALYIIALIHIIIYFLFRVEV
jgi:hypothetical protein